MLIRFSNLVFLEVLMSCGLSVTSSEPINGHFKEKIQNKSLLSFGNIACEVVSRFVILYWIPKVAPPSFKKRKVFFEALLLFEVKFYTIGSLHQYSRRTMHFQQHVTAPYQAPQCKICELHQSFTVNRNIHNIHISSVQHNCKINHIWINLEIYHILRQPVFYKN